MFVSINLTATFVGVLSTYFIIQWQLSTIFIIIILSTILSYHYWQIFLFENFRKLLFLIIAIAITTAIYSRFNPVIEMRQDPSLYAFNALNLINYGTLTKPLHALGELITNGVYSFSEWKHYAKIFNGTQSLSPGVLYGDFFPGATYVYASLGTICRPFVFYGPTFVMLSVCIVLYFMVYRIINDSFSAFLLTTLFLLSPIMTWFGRAFYSGPFALLFFLLILFLLIDSFEHRDQKARLIFLTIIISLSFFVRIEMFMLLLLGIFIVSYQNWKIGIVMLLSALFVMIAAEHNYPIYFTRMRLNSFHTVFYFWNYIAIAVYIFSISLRYVLDKHRLSLNQIISCKYLQYTLFLIFLVSALLIFRNDYADLFNQHQIKLIHGKIMRTFNEENLDRILLVFPAHIFFIGLGYLPFVIRKKSTSPLFKIVLIGLFLPNLLFLYKIYNSPMLYWAIRRYIPVLLPTVFIGFVFFLKDLKYRHRMIVIISSFIIMTNILAESRQRRDYKGLDIVAEHFTHKFKENDNYLFFYDKNLKYTISSLMSYGKYDFLPINSVSEVPLLLSNITPDTKRRVLYITTEKHPIDHQQFTIEYQKVGENYYALPQKYYRKVHNLYFYEIDLIAKNSVSLWADGHIWPNLSVSNISGFYGKGWTNGNAKLEDIHYNLQPSDTTITVKRLKRGRTPNKTVEDLALRVFINGTEAIFHEERGAVEYIFFLPKGISTIESIQIKSNTFIPKELGYSKDTHQKGIHINSITVQ